MLQPPPSCHSQRKIYQLHNSVIVHLVLKCIKKDIQNKYLIIVSLRGYIERGEGIWRGVAEWSDVKRFPCLYCVLTPGDVPSIQLRFQQLEYHKDLCKQSWHGERERER